MSWVDVDSYFFADEIVHRISYMYMSTYKKKGVDFEES